MPDRLINIALWGLLAALWSTSFLVIKIGVEEIPPVPLVAIRMVLASAVMALVLYATGRRLPRAWRIWWIMGVAGITGNTLPFTLISVGETTVDSAVAALMMGIMPVVTVLLAPLVHPDEGLSWRSILGIICGFLGLAVLFGPAARDGLGQNLLGQLLILGAALSYAFTTLFVRRHGGAAEPLVLATGAMIAGTVASLVALALTGLPPEGFAAGPKGIASALYLGLFPTALATLIYFFLVPRLGAARMSQINFVVPAAGAALGALVLGERIGLDMAIALGLIALAVLLVARGTGRRAARAARG